MAKMMKKAQDGYTSYGAKAGTPSPVTDYAGKPGKQDSYTQYKKGGVIKKKAQFGKAVADMKQADRDYKASDSIRKAPITGKTVKEKLDQMRSNRSKADSLFKAAEKRSVGGMKKGGKMVKKAKDGTSFGMLSVKAGIDKNPKPTQADRIAGAKGMAKKGAKVAKKMKSGGTVSMQLGSYTRTIGKNYSGKAKMGKSMGKCKYGC
jgi:hypothetical protein